MNAPLAEKCRPVGFEEIVGQSHLVGKEGFLTRTVEKGTPLSIIMWGPPGCGKTSIARLYAKAFDLRFVPMSAVFSGIADIKKIVKEVEETPLLGQQALLFVDEIHRFNKAQQDAFLPYLERGTFILVGATTENPSFSLNNALLSRVRVLTLHSLETDALHELLTRYEEQHSPLPLTDEARQELLRLCQGDGRYLFNLIENIQLANPSSPLTQEELLPFTMRRSALSDRQGDQHYNLISALHKSIRGSDPDASLYWFCRMLEGGEDPLFLARRLIRMATEDVGLADPQALPLAIAARETYETLGSPEGELALAQVVVYLALAPKSNAIYTAYKGAMEYAAKTNHLPPPAHILNAPTKLMKEQGYGKGYQYDHNVKDAFSGQNYFPADTERQKWYHPVSRGFEREMEKRIAYFEKLRRENGAAD